MQVHTPCLCDLIVFAKCEYTHRVFVTSSFLQNAITHTVYCAQLTRTTRVIRVMGILRVLRLVKAFRIGRVC